MLDWFGSLRLREHTPMRVVLSLSSTTRIVGALLLVGGVLLALEMWSLAPWATLLPVLVAAGGALLATIDRRMVFDREAGVLRIEQRTLFWVNPAVVPLFHLRAVVIVAQPDSGSRSLHSRYVAHIERRVGDAIYLDEARRCAKLLAIAEAIAEVADVRLEYDAMARAGR